MKPTYIVSLACKRRPQNERVLIIAMHIKMVSRKGRLAAVEGIVLCLFNNDEDKAKDRKGLGTIAVFLV
jgi:hypothetical protein